MTAQNYPVHRGRVKSGCEVEKIDGSISTDLDFYIQRLEIISYRRLPLPLRKTSFCANCGFPWDPSLSARSNLPYPSLEQNVVIVVIEATNGMVEMDDFCDVLLNKVKQDDFYALLGCDELASPEQINAEFRQKAKLHHPDKNPGDHTSEKLFERLVHSFPICSTKFFDFIFSFLNFSLPWFML